MYKFNLLSVQSLLVGTTIINGKVCTEVTGHEYFVMNGSELTDT